MERNYVYVETTLRKSRGYKYAVQKVEKYSTGISDPKHLMLYKKLKNEDWGYTDYEYKLWKGEKYGDRLGYNTKKQIGESYVESLKNSYLDEITVYELYKEI